MGPFMTLKSIGSNGDKTLHISSWYASNARFVDFFNPWFRRGGDCSNGVLVSQFNFNGNKGTTSSWVSFRLVLTP